RAITALKGIVSDERPLQWMQVAVAEPLGGDDVGCLMCYCQGQAAERAAPVQEDRAGAALPVVAPLLRAHDSQPLPQGIEQCCPGVHGKAVLRAVHADRDIDIHDRLLSPYPGSPRRRSSGRPLARTLAGMDALMACWLS